MKIYKVEIQSTNGLGDTAYDENHNKYLSLENGCLYVTDRDLAYIMDNYKFISVEYIGILFDNREDN